MNEYNPYQQQSFKFCSNCGTRLTQEQRFCPNCGFDAGVGAPVPAPQQYSALTPTPTPQFVPEQPSAPAYTPCVESQPQNNAEPQPEFDFSNDQDFMSQFVSSPESEVPKRPKGQLKSKILRIVGSSLMLVFAILMLISSFVPLVTYKVDMGLEKDLKINFNSIDSIKIAANSFASLDEEDLMEKNLELAEDYEEYFEDFEEGRRLNKASEYVKKMLVIGFQSEDVSPKLSFVVSGVLATVQIIISVILVIVALVKFIASFSGKGDVVQGASFMLFGTSAIMMFTNLYIYKNTHFLSAVIGDGDVLVSKWQLTMHIIVIVSIIATLALRIIDKPFRVGAKEIIKRSLGLAFAIALLISASMPLVNAQIKAEFDDTDKATTVVCPVKPLIFTTLQLDENGKEYFEEVFETDNIEPAEDMFEDFEYYSKKEVKKDEDGINSEMFGYLLFAFGGYQYSFAFALGTLVYALIVFGALVLLWHNIYSFVTRRKPSTAVAVLIKMLIVFMGVAALALAIVMMFIINFNADLAELKYTISLASGPIVMLISAIALTSVPMVKRRELNK